MFTRAYLYDTGSEAPELSTLMRAAIVADKPVHEALLCFEPVTLSRIAQCMAAAGVKCTRTHIKEYLDAQGATFITGDKKDKAAKAVTAKSVTAKGKPPRAPGKGKQKATAAGSSTSNA
jgi:Slx4 endonuclease